jgi:hypothetical protein
MYRLTAGEQSVLQATDAVQRLTLRDMRRLVYQFMATTEPMIAVRRHCVIFIVDPIR